MSEYILKARERNETGRAANNKLKKENLVPGIYYHKGEASVPLAIKYQDLMAMFSTPHTIIHLRVGAKNFQAIAKQIQYSPVARKPIHISFEGVSSNQTFHTKVHVKLKYDDHADWHKQGGVLQQLTEEVEVEVLPQDLPEYIEVDASHMKIGDQVHIKDLKYPKIKFLEDENKLLASVIMPRVEKEPEPETELTPADAAPAAEAKSEAPAQDKKDEDKKAS